MGDEFDGVWEQTAELWNARTGRDYRYAAPETSMTLSLLTLLAMLAKRVKELEAAAAK